MSIISLGDYSRLRGCFADDEKYSSTFFMLLDLYETASKTAYKTAQFSARNGTVDDILCAQHFETVAKTVEACIAAIMDEGDEMPSEVPARPHFAFK